MALADFPQKFSQTLVKSLTGHRKLQCLMFLFRLSGLFPFTFQVLPEVNLFPTRLAVYYHIFLMTIVVISGFYIGVPSIYKHIIVGEKQFDRILQIAEVAMETLIVGIILMYNLLNRKDFVVFTWRILRADEVAGNSRLIYNFKPLRKKWIVLFVTYIVLWVILIVTDYSEFPYPSEPIAWFLVYCVAPAIIVIFIVQYILAVGLIHRRMKALNEPIMQHLEVAEPRGRCAPAEAVIDDLIVDELQNWIAVHDELYEATATVTDFYSFPILLVIGYICYTIIFVSFYAVKDVCRNELDRVLIGVVNDFTWIFVVISPVAVLLFMIESTIAEARTKAIICRKLLLRFRENEEFCDQIHNYADELLHEKLHFTAFGFFSLNGSILHSIFGTTVTYLVIIFQMQGLQETST